MIELLTTNHLETILDLFEESQAEIKMISPFLTVSMAELLCAAAARRHISCTFITRLYLEDLIAKANSLDALELMLHNGITVYAVQKLHTKLYLFDGRNAILGSANFTSGGFKSNVELSLLLSDEAQVLEELGAYFDNMARELSFSEGGIVTPGMLKDAREKYAALYQSKKNEGKSTVRSIQMYGASLDKRKKELTVDEKLKELDACQADHDLVCELFQEMEHTEQIWYPYTIWLKFVGEGDDRFLPDETYTLTSFPLNGNTAYLSNYPFRAGSVKEDDEIYIAALTSDRRGKKQPVIIGRGHLAEFSSEHYATEPMLQKYDWMDRFPWFCIIKDCEVLDTAVKNGVPMDVVWDALGSDTYVASFGRQEDIPAVARKHYQKAHIRLSGNAKQFIDQKFDLLKAQYGTVEYLSK